MTRRSLALRAADTVRVAVNRAGFDVVREPFRAGFVHGLSGHGVDTVLDIGANTGQFALLLRRARFRGRIHSVEPLRAAYSALERAAREDASWSVQRAAVAGAPGTLTMNVSDNSVSSSVLPMLGRHVAAAPASRYVATEEVPATTVDELVDGLGVDPRRTLIKIDVQGYEKQVLDGARNTLRDIAGVRTEMSLVPLYEGQVLMPQLLEILAGHGLSLWHLERGFTEPGTRRLLQLDGTFFRG